MKKWLTVILAILVGMTPLAACAENAEGIAEQLATFFIEWEPETEYPAPASCNELAEMHISVKAMSLGYCLTMLRNAFVKSDGETLSEFVYDEENFDKFMNVVLVLDENGGLNSAGERAICGDNDEAFLCCSNINVVAAQIKKQLAARNLQLAVDKYAIDRSWHEETVKAILFAQLMLTGRLYLPENSEQYDALRTMLLGY